MVELQNDWIVLAAVNATMIQKVSENLLLLHALARRLLRENPLLLLIGQSLPTLFALLATTAFAVRMKPVLVASVLAEMLDRLWPTFEAVLR